MDELEAQSRIDEANDLLYAAAHVGIGLQARIALIVRAIEVLAEVRTAWVRST